MKLHFLLSLFLALGFVCRGGEMPAPPSAEPSEANPAKEIRLSDAVILGVVEGITEYLPISSTGHLILTERALGIGSSPEEKKAGDAYAMVIQFGAILAVIGLYHRHVLAMIRGLFGKDPQGLRLAINLLAGLIPAAFAGLLLNKFVRQYLFGLWPVVAAWFVGGIAILVIERWIKRDREEGSSIADLAPGTAFGIGCFQCLAMWPGVSRSLSTIVGGRLLGLNTRAAVEFSFLLGGVTLTAASAKDALDYGPEILSLFGLTFILMGWMAAFLSAIIAVRWLLGYLSKHSLSIFGWYRILLAVVVAVLLWTGKLLP